MDEKKNRNFITVGKASIISGLASQTIRKLADNSSIACYRTPAGQRRINLQSIQEMCASNIHDKKEQSIQKQNFIYARVSTKKQMDDLSRQIEYLRKPEYSEYVLIQDIASGPWVSYAEFASLTFLFFTLLSCLDNTCKFLKLKHSFCSLLFFRLKLQIGII